MAGGQIEVESGKWRWSVSRLGGAKGPSTSGFSRPSGEGAAYPEAEEASAGADLPVLLLEDPDDAEHVMSATMPGDVAEEDVSADELVALARDPDWRQLPGPDGRLWRVERIDKPEAVMEEAEFDRSAEHVRVSVEGGPVRVVPLPEGTRLGTLGRQELAELVQREG